MLEPIFHTKTENQSESYTQFVFEPLHKSFGHSMGNALRRVLLSSLKGAAVSYVKIENVPHLFSAVEGIKESILDIVLNIKQLRFSYNGEGPFKARLSVSKEGKIYGKDVTGEVQVVNEDLYIGEITAANASLNIEMVVEAGYGYIPSEEKEQKEGGYITLDSAFSPVKQVNFKVEEARVGRKSNFERLILDVWTDGSVSPREAVEESAQVLSTHFSYIHSGKDLTAPVETSSSEAPKTDEIDAKVYDTIIDELNLPSRVINALLRENIETIDDLLHRGKENLVGLKGVGRKSIDLIDDELKKMGVELR